MGSCGLAALPFPVKKRPSEVGGPILGALLVRGYHGAADLPAPARVVTPASRRVALRLRGLKKVNAEALMVAAGSPRGRT